MNKLVLLFSLLFLITSCSKDDVKSEDLNIALGHPWIKSDNIYVGDTTTLVIGIIKMPTNIEISIPDLRLYSSNNNIASVTSIWKNTQGNWYHSIMTANTAGEAYLYIEYKELKDSMKVTVKEKL